MSDRDAIRFAVLVLAAFWALASADALAGCLRTGPRWRAAMGCVLHGVLPGGLHLPLEGALSGTGERGGRANGPSVRWNTAGV